MADNNTNETSEPSEASEADKADKARLFVGVRIALEAVNDIRRAVDGFRRGGSELADSLRWVPPANYHVTLTYLGWAHPEVAAAVAVAGEVAFANVAPFEFRCTGAGAFPKVERASVVWIGVEEKTGALAAAANAIAQEVTALGFAAQTRAFHPHVTVARARRPTDASGLVDHLAEHAFSRTSVGSITLLESVIKPGGSEYVERRSWRLEPSS